jgi:4'-phosphopantetheinyl transferase
MSGWRGHVPALAVGECQLWWARADMAAPHLLELLDEGERERFGRFRRAQDRALYLVAHALARRVLAAHAHSAPDAVSYVIGELGKPRPDGAARGLELSLSHSGERAAVAVTRAVPVGVDVERVGADPEPALVRSVLSDAERAAFAALAPHDRPAAFARYWARKEAVLKATGDGLAVSPVLLSLTPPDAAPAVVDWSGARRPAEPLWLYDVRAGSGHAGALAAVGAAVAVAERDAGALLGAASDGAG